MRKLLGLLLWIGALFAAFLCWGTYIGDTPGAPIGMPIEDTPISYLVFMVVLLMISGIGRRIFHIKKSLVENVGTVPAILSRINCMRFYCSIVWYTALAFASFYFKSIDEDGGIIRFGIALLVCVVSFFFVRRSCPSCGFGLNHDGDEDDSTTEVRFESDSATATRGVTQHYHCPRCGRRVYIRSKRTIGHVKY